MDLFIIRGDKMNAIPILFRYWIFLLAVLLGSRFFGVHEDPKATIIIVIVATIIFVIANLIIAKRK